MTPQRLQLTPTQTNYDVTSAPANTHTDCYDATTVPANTNYYVATAPTNTHADCYDVTAAPANALTLMTS